VQPHPSKLIAFFLPQFHPTPENDKWWGKGYTEWRNATQARPLFRGHEQPHLPADLGFYDLRVPETRAAQADLAREYGIGAFCYYHYWFHGRRFLERPVNDIVASGEPDFPFCLCWANEAWKRTWERKERVILMEERYSDEDDVAHFKALLPIFRDPRYLRHEGCPVFMIYASNHLPNVKATITRWQKMAREHGLPGLHMLRTESHHQQPGDPRSAGFAAGVQFSSLLYRQRPRWLRGLHRVRRNLFGRWFPVYQHLVGDYRDNMRRNLTEPIPDYPRHPCVIPSWDNTARRLEDGFILHGSTPALYGEWLRQVLARDRTGFVFINAWNEWTEGCHLEPCQRHGRAYLEETRQAIQSVTAASPPRTG